MVAASLVSFGLQGSNSALEDCLIVNTAFQNAGAVGSL
jgi:hypothetical protein